MASFEIDPTTATDNCKNLSKSYITSTRTGKSSCNMWSNYFKNGTSLFKPPRMCNSTVFTNWRCKRFIIRGKCWVQWRKRCARKMTKVARYMLNELGNKWPRKWNPTIQKRHLMHRFVVKLEWLLRKIFEQHCKALFYIIVQSVKQLVQFLMDTYLARDWWLVALKHNFKFSVRKPVNSLI